MALNHITINTGARLGQQLRRFVDMQRECLDLAARLKAIMEEQIDVADYSKVETEFGVPAGKGQTVYNLLSGAHTEISSGPVVQTLNWLG